MTGFAMKIVIF